MHRSALASGLFFLILSSAAVADELIRVDPPTLAVPLGYGWRFTDNSSASPCVTGAESPSIPRSTYETAGEFSDTSTLARALNVSTHAQASFLAGSSEAEANYVLNRNSEVTGDRIAVYGAIRDMHSLIAPADSPIRAMDERLLKAQTAVHGKVLKVNKNTGNQLSLLAAQLSPQGQGIALTVRALNILTQKGRHAFEVACGQGYVKGIETGADLIAIYRFDSSKVEIKHQVHTALKGSVLGQQANVSLDDLATSLSNTSAELIDYRQFGGTPQTLPSDKAGFAKSIQSFPSSLPTGSSPSAKVYSLYVAPYGPLTVANWPAEQSEFTGRAETPAAALVEQYWLLDAIYNQLGEAIIHPDAYLLGWGVNLEGIKAHQSDLLAAKRAIKDAIKLCDQNGNCPTKPPLSTVDDYYGHLVTLPLPKSWSAEYDGLVAAYQRATDAATNYNKTHHETVDWTQQGVNLPWFSPRNDPTCYRRNNFNHTTLDPWFAQKVKPVLDDLQSRDSNFPAQIRLLMRTTYLEDVNRERCGVSVSTFGCVSASDLDRFVQRMPLTGPHGISYEQDEHVRGDCPVVDFWVRYAP